MFKVTILALGILSAIASAVSASDLPKCTKVSQDVVGITGDYTPVYSCRIEING